MYLSEQKVEFIQFFDLSMSEVSISLVMSCSLGVSQQIGVLNIILAQPRVEIWAVKGSIVRAGSQQFAIMAHYITPL